MQSVHEAGEKVVITRSGPPAAVLISPEEFESRRKTQHVSADADFMDEIRAGLAGLRSFRVGKFRIIYRRASAAVIDVVAVGSRKTIYAETCKLLKGEKQCGRNAVADRQ